MACFLHLWVECDGSFLLLPLPSPTINSRSQLSLAARPTPIIAWYIHSSSHYNPRWFDLTPTAVWYRSNVAGRNAMEKKDPFLQ